MNNLSEKQKRQKRGVIVMGVSFLIFSTLFYFRSNKAEEVTFGFILGDEWKLINEWKIDSKTGALIFLSIALAGVLVSYFKFKNNKNLTLGSFLFGFGSILAFLCWAAAGKFIPLPVYYKAQLCCLYRSFLVQCLGYFVKSQE